MTAKGWQDGMAMVRKNVGVLQLTKEKAQLMIRAVGQGQSSRVTIALVGQ